MADLIETPGWEPGIYQLETTDPVEGGPAGVDNLQAKQLANRTAYLKQLAETLGTGKQPIDALLTALSALVTSADKLAYFTGVDTVALTTLTGYMRTVLATVDAAAARTALGAASPADVVAAVASLVDASPATLDTLNELAAALGDDANFAATMTTALAGKAPLLSPALTGTPTVPTAAPGTDTAQAASTAFVLAEILASIPPVASGAGVIGNGSGLVEIPWDHESLVINGSFELNQRGLVSAAGDTYCLDRFYVLTESGNVTIAQITDPEAGAPWGIRLTQPDAGAKRMGLATIIESKDCRKLRSAVATLAARVKLSTGGTLRYAILEHAGTADSVTSNVVNNWASATFTPSNFFIAGVNVLRCGTITPGAATWGDLAGDGAVGAGMNNLIVFIWTEAVAAQSVTLDINRLRLVPGSVALPYRFRKDELMLAQRYFERGDHAFYAPAGGGGYAGSRQPYKVNKRVSPTLTILDGVLIAGKISIVTANNGVLTHNTEFFNNGCNANEIAIAYIGLGLNYGVVYSFKSDAEL